MWYNLIEEGVFYGNYKWNGNFWNCSLCSDLCTHNFGNTSTYKVFEKITRGSVLWKFQAK